MTTQDDGGPAFPFTCQGPTTAPEIYYGLSMRDYFAAKAMQAYFTDPEVGFGRDVIEAGAHAAYRIADAMLKARGGA